MKKNPRKTSLEGPTYVHPHCKKSNKTPTQLLITATKSAIRAHEKQGNSKNQLIIKKGPESNLEPKQKCDYSDHFQLSI
jgi:hypothetical protein